jgi:hypothetical protein
VAVEYALEALVDRLVGRGGRLQFRTDADPMTASIVFRTAASRAEAPHVSPGLDGLDTIATDPFVIAPDGPLTDMHLCDNAELLAGWLHNVAAELGQAGMSGRLEVPPRAETPTAATTRVNAVIALKVDYEAIMSSPHDYDSPPVGWWVSGDRTQRVLPALVDWCLDAPGEVWLFCVTAMRLRPEDARRIVLADVFLAPELRLQRTTTDRRQQRTLHLSSDGEVILSSYDPDQSWAHHFEALQEPLRHAAPDAAHAFVRSLPPAINHDEAWRMAPPAPVTVGPQLPTRHWPLAHLQADYIPDAYVQQVVTSAHLNRMQERHPLDPQRWRIENLGHDRHVVTSTDPAPWLDADPRAYTRDDNYDTRPPLPGLETLASARADFAPALLTRDVLAKHPTPPLTGPRLGY